MKIRCFSAFFVTVGLRSGMGWARWSRYCGRGLDWVWNDRQGRIGRRGRIRGRRRVGCGRCDWRRGFRQSELRGKWISRQRWCSRRSGQNRARRSACINWRRWRGRLNAIWCTGWLRGTVRWRIGRWSWWNRSCGGSGTRRGERGEKEGSGIRDRGSLEVLYHWTYN
jgi:hypothetical protein